MDSHQRAIRDVAFNEKRLIEKQDDAAGRPVETMGVPHLSPLKG
jgi:hypothetical protein